MATRGWDSLPSELAGRVRTTAQRTSSSPLSPSSPPRRKYRNAVVEINGIRFDSKAEAEYWLKLRDREARGEIHSLQRQVAFALRCPVETAHDLIAVAAHYIADFTYYEGGHRHVVDVKRSATQTAVYRLKRKWLELQTGIVIEEVAG